MRTDFDFPKKDMIGSVVFRPDFNNFETINVNQAWSLFFSKGQDDKTLGQNVELGRFFTNLIIALVTVGSLWETFFSNVG
ncbi:hypothetical protein [Aulosira sp. FACHB-615]|uniref:hypothetical protein n=1 Tax=Aulosira sp. FACHB-615 TaxID=2692777 RepID=UPI001684682A|nr:hypothetical protein [Aulosira sp. FACHB-615]MBD2489366.1 hypothetical protein [Aulosira sp. FACHB-615]